MDATERMTRLAEAIEELTGADYDTAAQLAHEVIVKAAAMRAPVQAEYEQDWDKYTIPENPLHSEYDDDPCAYGNPAVRKSETSK